MIEKFHKNLLNQVTTLSQKKYKCVVSSCDFNSTKNSLNKLKIEYKAYPFTNSFYVNTSYNNLMAISNLSSVEFLTGTTKVTTAIYNSKKFINY